MNWWKKLKQFFGIKTKIITRNERISLREKFNTVLQPRYHYTTTSWECHLYEQKTYGKCSFTDNCRFCEKEKNGEIITEDDKIDTILFLG